MPDKMMEVEAEGPAGAKGKERETCLSWLPDGMEPVLEGLPKWTLLGDVLHEIGETIRRAPTLSSCTSPPSLSPAWACLISLTTTMTYRLTRVSFRSPNARTSPTAS